MNNINEHSNDYSFSDFTDFILSTYRFNEIAEKHTQVDLKSLKQQVILIQEEVKELAEGLDQNNPENVLAETIDVLVTTLGLLQKLEVNSFMVIDALQEVAQANLSKFSRQKQVVLDSQIDYAKKGITVDYLYNYDYSVFILKDQAGKIRKPIDFIPADVSWCVPDEFKKGFKDGD